MMHCVKRDPRSFVELYSNHDLGNISNNRIFAFRLIVARVAKSARDREVEGHVWIQMEGVLRGQQGESVQETLDICFSSVKRVVMCANHACQMKIFVNIVQV